MKTKQLVIDTGAFLTNIPLWEYGDELYTCEDVIKEIRDKTTKQRVAAYPVEIILREPSASALHFVSNFTKMTGDFQSLSCVDFKILALTYELEVECRGSDHLRKEPIKCKTHRIIDTKPPDIKDNKMQFGFYNPNEKFNDDEEETIEELHEIEEATSKGCKFILELYHLKQLNDYLSDKSYFGGFEVSNDDLLMMSELLDQFIALTELQALASSNNTKQTTSFLWDINCSMVYINLLRSEMATKAAPWSNSDMSFSSVLKQQKKSNEFEEGEALLKKLKDIKVHFAKFPHLLRWFWQMCQQQQLNVTNNSVSESNAVTRVEILFGQIQAELISKTENMEEIDDTGLEAIADSAEDVSINAEHNEENINELDHDNDNEDDKCEFEEIGEYIEDDDSCLSDDVSDDDDGWITPASLAKQKAIHTTSQQQQHIYTACITGDFAMQNVMKHIGLHILGVDGKLIERTKTYILRCFACFTLTNKVNVLFCPKCGNKTLKRVSVTLNPDGTQHIWINSKRPINIRGTKFSLPAPKGGKHAINPILVADQREVHQHVTKLARKKTNPLDPDYVTGASPFVQRDVYSRSAQLGIRAGRGTKQHKGIFYWERRNPNVPIKSNNRKKH